MSAFSDPYLAQFAKCLDGYDYEVADWDKLPQAPLVSVKMITYQHAAFIREALDSVLMQQVDFPYEIVIGEDGSTDGTREICVEYAKKHPHIIRLILRDRKNPGRQQYSAPWRFNSVETSAKCRGKYVALLEGDDYWIITRKLNIQVEALERDPDLVLIGGTTQIITWNDNRAEYAKGPLVPQKRFNRRITTRDILLNYPFHASTVIYRNHVAKFSQEYINNISTDYNYYILMSCFGGVRHMDELMSHYRLHAGGVFSSLSSNEKWEYVLRRHRYWKEYFGGKHRWALNLRLGSEYSQYMQVAMRKNAYQSANCIRNMSLGQLPALYCHAMYYYYKYTMPFITLLNKITMALAVRTRVRRIISKL